MGPDRVDAATGGPFRVKQAGRVGVLPGPADLPWRDVLKALQSTAGFMAVVGRGARLPSSTAEALAEAWVQHHDMPSAQQARRLAYLLERYHDEIEYDLLQLPGCLPLGELWRSRRWRLLLNVIDHLPRHSWYSAAVANDEEHAKLLAEAQAKAPRRVDDQDDSPPLAGFTHEVEALRMIVNELRVFRAQFVQSKQAKGAPRVEPSLLKTPRTALQRAMAAAERARKKAKHEALVARVLPHKRRKPDDVG